MKSKTNPKTSIYDQSRITAMYKEIALLMGALYSRWQEEKHFENIAEYALPINLHMRKYGYAIVKMTKSPFGFHFTIAKGSPVYAVTITSKQYCWLRVGQ